MSRAAEKKPVRAENEEMHSVMEADNSCAASPIHVLPARPGIPRK